MDFLTIGSKRDGDSDKNVLVITDHFTRLLQPEPCRELTKFAKLSFIFEFFYVVELDSF